MKSMSSLSRGSGGQVVGSFSIAWGGGRRRGVGREEEGDYEVVVVTCTS